MGARLEDIALTIQAHPTLGEAFHEAALSALGTRCTFEGHRRRPAVTLFCRIES